MKKINPVSWGMLLFLFILFSSAYADTIVLHDGDRYQGKIIFEDEKKVHLQMEIGVIKFNRDEIAGIRREPVEVSEQGEEEPERIPFPEKSRKKVKRIAPTKIRPGTPVRRVVPSGNQIQMLDQDQKSRELDYREKELELKRKELELRRRELDLKSKESVLEKKEKPEQEIQPQPVPEESVETEEKEPVRKIENPEPEPEPEVEEEPAQEEEDLKSKGYTITPKIKGTGRYRTY